MNPVVLSCFGYTVAADLEEQFRAVDELTSYPNLQRGSLKGSLEALLGCWERVESCYKNITEGLVHFNQSMEQLSREGLGPPSPDLEIVQYLFDKHYQESRKLLFNIAFQEINIEQLSEKQPKPKLDQYKIPKPEGGEPLKNILIG